MMKIGKRDVAFTERVRQKVKKNLKNQVYAASQQT